MGKGKKPRSGSMGVWPRKRATSEIARIRVWAKNKEVKPLGFAGYKVGMTHAIVTDNRPNSITKGEELFMPLTIIECPPIKVFGVNCYQQTPYGFTLSSTILLPSTDKHLSKSISFSKKTTKTLESIKPETCSHFKLLVHTNPAKTGIGKKKPEIFELAIGGDTQAQYAYAKNILGKELHIKDIFTQGNHVDLLAITKGKGFQGPVRRFGISLKQHKSEKGVREPGSLGGWRAQGHVMYRVAHAGQMGYHQRTDFNKWIIHIGEKPENINIKGGYLHYGVVKNPYILIKGSVQGPAKRLIKMIQPRRPNKKIPNQAPVIEYLHLSTHQGKTREAA
ncbi:50S ribosomal protein L3 [Candidatus Woesearchaeota archaeon]|nr:50S ribosomal protein L3 [Candidatus Woesearchaeota archaeon]